MRHAPAIVLLVLLVACGGGTPTDTGTPTPPVTPPPVVLVPAVVTVTAGDGQTAEPGANVAIRPVVRVADAAGTAVSGVTVNFAVDSGGGTVQASSATTATDGTASPGDWRLGGGETRNVLRATVAALAPAKIVATAAVPTVTLVTQTVPSGGGTLEINSGVLSGTKLVIPASAFTTTGTWKLEQRSNADWPRRRGVNPAGATLHITSTDTGAAAKPMMLTLPVQSAAGTKPFVLMRNRATNATQVLQTIAIDAGTITVAAQHFDATWQVVPSQGPPSTRGFQRSAVRVPTLSYDTDVIVSNIPVAELDGDVDTGFRPGVDDWDMIPMDVSMLTSPGGAPRSSLELGFVLTEMAYFASMKTQGGALHKKYRQFPEVDLSNKVGFRSVAFVSATVDGGQFEQSLITIRNAVRAGQADQVFYDVLKANLIVSGLPQLVAARVAGGWYPMTAYRAIGGRIDVVNPLTPGVGTALQFSAGRFDAFSPVINDVGATATAEWVGVVPAGQILKMPTVAEDIAAFASGSEPGAGSMNPGTPDVSFFPEAKVNARGGFVDDTIMYLGEEGDSTRFWVECATCVMSVMSPLPPGKVEPFVGYFRAADGTLRTLTGQGADGRLHIQTGNTDTRVGFVMLESDGTKVSWLDFQWLRFKRWKLTLQAPDIAVVGSAKTFTVNMEGPDLPNRQFVWTFGTGQSAQTVITTEPTVSTTFSTEGSPDVKVELRRTSDTRVLADDRGVVTVKNVFPAWKFTSFNLVLDQPGTDPLVGNPLIGSSNHFSYPLGVFNGIKDGLAQGGLMYIARDTSFLDRPNGLVSLKKRGLYLLDSPLLTNITLAKYLWAPAEDTQFGFTADMNRVRASWIVSPSGTARAADQAALNEKYVETGTIAAGSIVANYWRWQTSTNSQQLGIIWFPFEIRQADVAFNGTTATGTITIVSRDYDHSMGNSLPKPENRRWTMRVTFTAERLK